MTVEVRAHLERERIVDRARPDRLGRLTPRRCSLESTDGQRHVHPAPADNIEDTDRLGGAKILMVIGASGVGTMIEWYGFYIFASLVLVLASQFYPSGN